MSLRYAIIGCGSNTPGKGGAHSIGYAHGWAIGRMSGAELVAVADRVEKNALDFGAEFKGCAVYTDYRTMLERERPDVVVVSAFPPFREEMVLAALASGAKGILIEKPMAMGLGAARRMVAAAEKAGVRLFVHHQRRYGKPFEWWRQAVQEKEIGDLEGIDIAEPAGCLFIDFGPHLVDAALYAMGTGPKAVRVMAVADRSETGNYQGVTTESQLLASVHFDNGVRLTVETGKRVCGELPILRANGTRGFVELRMETRAGEAGVFRKVVGEGGLVNPSTNENFHCSEDGTLYIHRAHEDVYRALTTGSRTRIEADEALRGLEIIMGVYEAARVGRLVEFPILQEEFPLGR